MSIRYITTGDEFKSRSLLGEGRHQLSILKNAMQFQGLQQNQRIVEFDDGTIIKCLSCFGQDVVNVFTPIGGVAEEKKIVEIRCCWCTNWFTEGKVIEIYADYGDVGDYEVEYPANCNAVDIDIKNYIGIRYLVNCCQGTLDRESDYREYTEIDELENKEAEYKKFLCLPSDFAEYKIDDRVIVFMRGQWDENILIEPKRIPGNRCLSDTFGSCIACDGTRREGRNAENNEADGSYLIMPLGVQGVNFKL